MLIPCTDIRSASGTEQWNEHGRVDIAIRVEDAFRSVSTVVLPVRILADSPTIAFEGMQITPGWYDATALAIHDGWFRGFRYERIGPFAPAAVGRYRSVSSDNWIYFNLSAALPQSDRGFHFPPIMSPLALRTIYEVQGAWMWTALFDCSYEGCRGLDTWRDWSSPGLLHWSDSQYFKTGGPSCAEAYVFGNSITVSHSEVIPAESQSDPEYEDCTWGTHRVLTYLTSPDWPGVIWAYQFRGRKPSWEETLKPAERFIARYSGLPEHSEYVLTMQEPLPSSFRPAPRQSVVVRTGPTQDQTAMPAVDPSVVQIRVGADQIIVEWKDYGPLFRESINLYAKSGQRTYRSERGYRDGPRVGKVFASLDGHREFVLYFSLIAGEAKDDAPQYPSMCIVKEIRLPAGGSDAYFDRYFTVPPLNVGPTIVPGPIPEVRFEYRFNYHQVGGCLLGEYSFP